METPEVKIPEPRLPDPNTITGRLIGKLEEKKLAPSKAHWWDRVWAWANGKKLYAGAVLMVAGGVLHFIPGTQAAGWVLIGKGTATVGTILAGTGLLHKIFKQYGPGEKGIFGNKELIELIIGILELIVKLITKLKKK